MCEKCCSYYIRSFTQTKANIKKTKQINTLKAINKKRDTCSKNVPPKELAF